MQETTYRTKPSISRAFSAIALTCLPAWLFAYLSINVFEDYALGMFVWLPVMMGAVSTMIYGYRNTTGRIALRNMSYTVLLIFCLGLLTFAWEGIICLVMAAPLGILFTYFGFLVGHALVRSRGKNNTPVTIIIFLLSVPAFMAFEHTGQEKENIRSVTTSIQINASPEAVWEDVIAFPELNNPDEFVFKTGIAYPVNATIKGQGVGAVRYCNFSTGSFIEPITVWDKPGLLKFSVEEQPEPMKELSPYNIHPNHLHGYWVSKEGQFRLIKLANGNTLLEGTTWYVNKIKPGLYWTLWSDYIVHKIHNRVLLHIKMKSEERVKK